MDTKADAPSLPADWVADLRASKAEIERGDCVLMRPTLDRMRAAVRRIEKHQADADNRKA